MSDGFELAPRPLAVFDATGALITQNEADRLCFGSATLSERLQDPRLAEHALSVALVDESLSKDYILGPEGSRWRIEFRRLRGAGGELTVLAEFSDLPMHGYENNLDYKAVAAIAHDFRAPLTAIRGFAEFLMKNTATAERQADYLTAIQAATSNLNDLADRFVAIGRQETPRQFVDLNDIARQTSNLFDAVASSAGASIRVQDDPSAAPVLTDPVAVTRILQNLVSNAVRHSTGDTIEIKVDSGSISVTDNGAVIDQKSIDALLTSPEAEGGLGLSNCLALAKSSGAKIEFTSTPGTGFAARLSFET